MYQRIRLGLGAAVFAAILALVPLLSAGAAAPRLAGTYQTNLTIAYAKNVVNVKAGDHAVRPWTFNPLCTRGGCLTVLYRPSIAPGSTTVYAYTLKPVSATQYKGSIKPALVACFFSNGTQVAKAYTNHQTLVLIVTKAAGGKVLHYSGTVHTLNLPTAVGKARGCNPRRATSDLQGLG
jgi:hypothetical protein